MKKLVLSMVAISAMVYGGKNVSIPEVPPISIPHVVVDSWSGPYVGVAIGYVKGKGDNSVDRRYTQSSTFSEVAITTTVNESSSNSLKPGGFVGGVFAGYNKKLDNNFLIGVEGAYNYLNNKKSGKLIKSDGTQSNISYKLKQKNEAALYLRFGKIIDNRYMPYLLGGISWSKLYATASGVTKSKSTTGPTIGAGVEIKINKNWNARVQYRYSKYSSKRFNILPNLSAKTKYKSHMVQVGISYQF